MANKTNAVVEVDPISRIEGHLGVKLHTGPSGKVTSAEVHGNLWRGFENFLLGRKPNDAITFTQRICGVCPVPHGTASTFAVDAVYGYNDNFQTFSTLTAPAGKGVPPKALHIRNLVLSAEFLMSSMTHFYHLAAPSYVQGPNMAPWTPYFNDVFYHPYLRSAGHGTDGAGGTGVLPLDVKGFSKDLWSAVIKQYVKALRIRRLTFEAGALFAGRMPMTSSLVAGGVTVDKNENLASKISKFRSMMVEVGAFIVKEYVPVVLALGALYPNYDNLANATALNSVASGALWKAAHADNLAETPDAGNTGYGAGCGNFLSWGAFPQTDGTLGTPRGSILKAVAIGGAPVASAITVADVKANLREHIAYSRYAAASSVNDNLGVPNPAGVTDPQSEVRTIPLRSNAAKYSWLKAPRWNGAPMEVGPLARLVVSGAYKVNGTAIVAPTSPYLKTVTRGDASTITGVDPAMIEADLAVALVREGLATLTIAGPTAAGDVVADATVVDGLADKAAIVAAYTNPNAVITGVILTWLGAIVGGLSNMDRLRARALESLGLIQQMIGTYSKTTGFPALETGTAGARPAVSAGWLNQLGWENGNAAGNKDTYLVRTLPTGKVSGFGATEAPRGALMHVATIEKNKIVAYQCIVPTTWNASPKDAGSVHGPMETAMEGVPYNDAPTAFTGGGGSALTAGGGVEALRVAQSFDPCIACAVH